MRTIQGYHTIKSRLRVPYAMMDDVLLCFGPLRRESDCMTSLSFLLPRNSSHLMKSSCHHEHEHEDRRSPRPERDRRYHTHYTLP